MKKHYTYVIMTFVLLMAIRLFTFHADGNFPAGYTNSPGDNNQNCTACHLGSAAQSVSNAITTNIPASGYVPGGTYTITATISHGTFNKFGFMITSEDVQDNKVGEFISTSTETQTLFQSQYITHTATGTAGTSNSRVWTFNWIAPPLGTGNVTFYGSFNCANGDNDNTGDEIRTSTTTVAEDTTPVILPLQVDVIPQHESCTGLCDGSITVNISGGVPPYTTVISGGNDQNLCPDTYYISVTDDDNTTVLDTTVIDTGVVVTKPVVSQQNHFLIAQSPDADSYLWYVNGNLIPGADSSEVEITQNGAYVAEAVSITGCTEMSDTFMVTNFSVVSLSDLPITLYPNPSANHPYLKISDQLLSKLEHIGLHDMSGKELQVSLSSSRQIRTVSDLPSGYYTIQLRFSDGRIWHQKWIKQ
jgi:hypothetical protein